MMYFIVLIMAMLLASLIVFVITALKIGNVSGIIRFEKNPLNGDPYAYAEFSEPLDKITKRKYVIMQVMDHSHK